MEIQKEAALDYLLCSLGSTEAVVIEAIYALRKEIGGEAALSVFVITSTSETTTASIKKLSSFIQSHTEIIFEISRVEGFSDLSSTGEQELFDEALVRWYLRIRSRLISDGRLHVCLAGGFKTMSSSMQQTAGYFGAHSLFHIIATQCVEYAVDKTSQTRRREPNTEKEISQAFYDNNIHVIRLNESSGWPQLINLNYEKYRLIESIDTTLPFTKKVSLSKDGCSLTGYIKDISARSHNIVKNMPLIPTLPFPELASWDNAGLLWLNDPLNPDSAADKQWIKALPKIDLHLHFGGFASHGKLLNEVQSAATRKPDKFENDPELPEKWPQPDSPIALREYMQLGNATGSKLLSDSGCLVKQCELLYRHLDEQNVKYAEVRCSPVNYVNKEDIKLRTPWEVLGMIRNTFAGMMREKPDGPFINLIIIATRRLDGDNKDYRSDISRHLSLAITASEQWADEKLPCVVGVDLAGYETPQTRADTYRADFTGIHRCGLAITVHAGENDGAEGIWKAVFALNARRIGHALSLEKSQDLLRSISDRRIAIEMCPYSNYQTKGFSPMPDKPKYPLKDYLDKGVAVTINTDNPGISSADISENILFVAKMNPEFTRLDVLRCLRNALDAAFISHKQRSRLIEKIVIPPIT